MQNIRRMQAEDASYLTRLLDAHEPHKLGDLLAVVVLREACATPFSGLLGLVLGFVRPEQLPLLNLTNRERLETF